MAYILVRPDNSSESLTAIKYLNFTSEHLLGFNLSDSHLIPVFFNYRLHLDHKKYYHFFVCELVCGC